MKILIISLLVSFSCVSQKNVRVEYAAIINPVEKKYTNAKLIEIFQYAMDNDDKLSYELLITKNGSRFKDISAMGSSESSPLDKMTMTFSGYLGEVYNTKDSTYAQSMIIDPKILVKKENIKNWQLTNESKEISGYVCYKAIGEVIVNSATKNFKNLVTAWYCPKLPFNYGPNGHGNLPGLILELQVRNVVFGAKKIDLDSEFDFDNNYLKKYKVITETQLMEMIEKDAESMRPKDFK